ncbi:hypothetical protein [Streptomyces sp. CA-111067]|uniref:hypothetical protein n=1 Tax=Streptomyces sp. CA-111067 TaxID=3240046 RepID=UPI003D951B84
MNEPKLILAAQRYEDAEEAREAAAEDLRAESAAALAHGTAEKQVAEITGIPLEDLRQL